MNRSINSKYRLLITILLGLLLLESLILLASIVKAKDLSLLASDLQTIIIVFVFIIFIYGIVIFNYIPFRLKKSVREVSDIIDEISLGNYNVNIDEQIQSQDADLGDLVHSLKKMLTIVQRFDQAKAEKIYEHHQRLQLLINLLPQSVIIAGVNGDVAYCNDSIRRKYANLTEMVNLNELIFKSDFDNRVFTKIIEALRFGNNLYDATVTDASESQRAVINGSIVRNQKGVSCGGVFVVNF